MEKIKTTSLKKMLIIYIMSALMISLLLTIMVQMFIGQIEFSSFVQNIYDDFWNEQHYFFRVLEFLSVIIIVFSVISILVHRLYKKAIANNIHQLSIVLDNLKSNNLDFEIEKSNIKEFNTILSKISSIKSELEDQLKAQWLFEFQKQKQLQIIKHEIKTPIAIIQGHLDLQKKYVNLLDFEKKKLILNESQIVQKYVDILKEKITLNLELISNHISTEKVDIDFEEIKSHVSYQLDAAIGIKNKQLSYNIHFDENNYIHTNVSILYEIIDNLINNAIQFSKSKIQIALSIKDKQFVFDISNDSSPFTDQELGNVFDWGYKCQTSKGSGIGLYYSNYLSKILNATLAVQNTRSVPHTILYIPNE